MGRKLGHLKFKVTPERVSEACGYIELMNLSTGDRSTAYRVAPRFALEPDGEYSMRVEYNADGDIEKFVGYEDTLVSISQVTPKRLETLIAELCEAARNVVNPPKGKG